MAHEVEVMSHDEAVAHKENRAGVEAKIWRVTTQPNAAAAANFLNLNPAQGAGEAFASNRADGRVDVYFFL
ncbi:MAG TPA: hypothetical protein VF101_00180 [Gaiellaceae bacterium]